LLNTKPAHALLKKTTIKCELVSSFIVITQPDSYFTFDGHTVDILAEEMSKTRVGPC
jgi:hypothetical protein